MNTQDIKPNQIFEKEQVLTLSMANSLKGKMIATTSSEYHMNIPYVRVFIVGEIISEWDYAATRDCKGWPNRQAYWLSYFNENQISASKTKLILFGQDGVRYHVCHTMHDNFFDEPTFVGSDADREVYYIEIEN